MRSSIRHQVLSGAFFALLAALCLAGTPAPAATLRNNVTVDHPRVRLSDLFSGLGPGQDTEIGDAPALGASYVVGGPQLTAIAMQFGVDWPDASPLVSTTLTRATRFVGEDEILPALQAALDASENAAEGSGGAVPATASGAAHMEIALLGFHPVPVPLGDERAPVVIRLERPAPGTERFTARLQVPSASGKGGTAFTVGGTMTTEVRAVTLRHGLRAGEPILADNVAVTYVRSTMVPPDALTAPEDAIGLQPRTTMVAGEVLASSILVHPQLVRKLPATDALLNISGLVQL